MLRAYNEETKCFQANDRSAGGGHFKPPFKAFSTDVREPWHWCLENLNKTFLHKEQDCRNKIRPPQAHQAHGDKRGRESSECFICKGQGHRAAVCPHAAKFQAIIQQQQERANLAAHQAAHDAVAYRVMMGESAANSSMSTTVSTERSPATSRQASAGGFYFQCLTQLDGCSHSRSSPSVSPSQPCTPPTPSTPSGTWRPQLQTCEPTRVITVYEYGKPPSYPGPDVFYCSSDTPGNNPGLSLRDNGFKIPEVHRPSPCNCVDCWDARARGGAGRIVGGLDARLLTDNKFTNACRLMQPVVTEYRVVRNKGSSTSTVTWTDELSDERSSPSDERSSPAPPMGFTLTGLVNVPIMARSMAELQEMDPDMAAYVTQFAANSVAHQVNETGKTKQDEQERVCPKRAHDTRALSPLHRRQLKRPPLWLESRQPHAAAIDSSGGNGFL